MTRTQFDDRAILGGYSTSVLLDLYEKQDVTGTEEDMANQPAPDTTAPLQPITGTHIYGYQICDHAIYLDFHGDSDLRVAPDEFLQLLFERGAEHEERVAEPLGYPSPSYQEPDWIAGHHSTLELMAKAVPGIYQAVLMQDGYLGKPDLLRRTLGRSRFGEWAYEVGDVKSSRKVKAEQILQVTFYSYLLEQAQGVRPGEGFIILGDGTEERFRIADYYWVLLDVLDEINAIRRGERQTDYHIRRDCDSCRWQEVCKPAAEGEQDLSLVYGLNRSHKRLLRAEGIKTIADLAAAKIGKLVKARRLRETTLTRLQQQAEVLLSGRLLVKQPLDFPMDDPLIAFDMESDPHSATEYLIGLLVQPNGGPPTFTSFIAERPEDEEVNFHRFLAHLATLPATVPIYHYAAYEPTHLEQLFLKYGGDSRLLLGIQERLCDIFQAVRRSVVLPLTSYSLKPVAKYLGFCWDDAEADAAASVVWYNRFLAEGDRSYLDRIRVYNKNDLEATLMIARWLRTLTP